MIMLAESCSHNGGNGRGFGRTERIFVNGRSGPMSLYIAKVFSWARIRKSDLKLARAHDQWQSPTLPIFVWACPTQPIARVDENQI